MADKTLLCTCVNCLKENPNGIQLNLNTYNRHRKRQQELSKKDEILEVIEQKENVKVFESQVEDVLYQEEFQTENILNQEEFQIANILHQKEFQTEDINKSDQDDSFNEDDKFYEDFNFSEEDNEYYSDYNIEKENDNDKEDIENDDNNENDDDNDNKTNDEDEESNDENNSDVNEDDDVMQIDDDTNILNKEIIEGLKLLHLKTLYNFTESAYDDIMKIFTTNNISLYKVKKYLKDVIGLVPVFYDMCENSCICYTGSYELYQNCPICNSSRFDAKGKAKKVMPYLSLIDRLKVQFNDNNRSKELLYRHKYITNKNDDDLDDIFDGKIYKELVNKNLFNDERDVVLTASCDGYQIFKQKTDDCWLFIVINNNLHPSLRVKKENLLVPFLIPGPNQPKDFNTFLRPFINEMKQLESKYFYLYLFI